MNISSLFGSDWYIVGYDSKDQIMFGFAILNGDYRNPEWGCMSYSELRDLNVKGFEVDRDLYWKPKKAQYIAKIVKGGEI
jgi:Protein of unknown function (DUF2958)